MKDRLYKAFDEIQADNALLEKTAASLHARRAAPNEVSPRPRAFRLAGALAAMLLLVGIFGYNLYFTAAAYVSIDVNPSMELTLNRMDRVIGIHAFNTEGERILLEVDLNGKRYDDAVSILLTAMEQDGYLTADALISLTVQTTSGTKEQSLCYTLQQSIIEQANGLMSTAEVEVFPVSSETWENAHGCRTSPAKYLAIQELLEVDEAATLEQYRDSSIRQIRQRTRQCQQEHGGTGENDEGQSQGQGQNQGQGQGGGHGHGYHGGR